MPKQLDLVTGAFGYSGKYITRRLLDRGHDVRTLTGHDRPNPFDRTVDVRRYTFDDFSALVDAFSGVTTFYNTYWVRFPHAGTDFEQGVKNSRLLVEAAAAAGVERIVHISITKPSLDSPYRYFSGKAEVEECIAGSGLSYAIVRPTVIFGDEDILINNVAWLLRRLHVFAIPGDGRYRVRPVFVDDLAKLCVEAGDSRDDVTVDAVGPEAFSFEELVRTVADATRTRALVVRVPAALVPPLTSLLNLLTGDVVLTRDELAGMMDELCMVDSETTCPARLTGWLHDHADTVGKKYHSEVARHYR